MLKVILLGLLFGAQVFAYTPVVLYHGLGDSCCSSRMNMLISAIKSALSGVFIHSIQIGDSQEDDRKKSLFDDMNRQIDQVCKQLAGIPELKEGFNAIGLSQGGQFMRAYVERCNEPRVKKLITLGSQHQGVMALPGCVELEGVSKEGLEGNFGLSAEDQRVLLRLVQEQEVKEKAVSENIFMRLWRRIRDFFVKPKEPKDSQEQSTDNSNNNSNGADDTPTSNCSWWKKVLKLGVYAPYVRENVVQAQYFKDPKNLDSYHRYNKFLQDINNDWPVPDKRKSDYRDKLISLEGFYMYIFEGDTVVVPKESGWFGVYDEKKKAIKYLSEQDSFGEDRIGLKTLWDSGRLFFRKLPGEHLDLNKEFIFGELKEILEQ